MQGLGSDTSAVGQPIAPMSSFDSARAKQLGSCNGSKTAPLPARRVDLAAHAIFEDKTKPLVADDRHALDPAQMSCDAHALNPGEGVSQPELLEFDRPAWRHFCVRNDNRAGRNGSAHVLANHELHVVSDAQRPLVFVGVQEHFLAVPILSLDRSSAAAIPPRQHSERPVRAPTRHSRLDLSGHQFHPEPFNS
jgi:hypothetical protein